MLEDKKKLAIKRHENTNKRRVVSQKKNAGKYKTNCLNNCYRSVQTESDIDR